MDRAILKTLAYFDYFNYPLKAWEIHKWLIQKKGSLTQVEKTLSRMGGLSHKGGYWFLSGRKGLVKNRLEKEKISRKHLLSAKMIAGILKMIPWIKLIGISGNLAVMGSSKKDDIDFFVITSKNRIWLSRLFLIFLTTLTGLRRKRREKLLSASGKICINLILEVDNLAQKSRNIYLAHEVLQMHLLWQRDEVYSKFLHDNNWAFKYLPNWKSGVLESQKSNVKSQKHNSKSKSLKIIDWLEGIAKKWQLRIMNGPSGAERIENGALYFHPEDKGIRIMEEYNKRLKKLSLA